MKEREVITDIEQLTPEWLTNIFKKNGFLNKGKVIAINRRKAQKSTASNVYLLEIIFSDDAQRNGITSKTLKMKKRKRN